MSDAKDALAAIGINWEEAVEADSKQTERKPRDQRVCLCGHGINRHTDAAGTLLCKPSQIDCKCKKLRPVIEVEDTRLFLRKTNGAGQEHALIRGMSALAKAGKSAKWIEPAMCDRCGKTDGRILPVPLNKASLTIANEGTGIDALLCTDCMEKI
jgi:hypothetical protein